MKLFQGILGLFFIILCPLISLSQNNQYQKPPKEITEIIEAAKTNNVLISDAGKYLLVLTDNGYPSIKDVSKPVLKLAGIRVNPQNNALGNQNFYSSIVIKDINTNTSKTINGLPPILKAFNFQFSPDEEYLAFANITDDGVHLWLADLKSATAKRLTTGNLNTAMGKLFEWHHNSESIIAKFLPENKGKKPVQDSVPTGPIVQENVSGAAPSRTYQDLLKNKYDEQLFDYYFTSQLKKISLNGKQENLGSAGIIKRFTLSPDGDYVLQEMIKKPYSYLVPSSFFPYQVLVLNLNNGTQRTLTNVPSAENLPLGFDAVTNGPRNYSWRKDKPNTLFWVEAQDNGNPNIQAYIRDILYTQPADGNEPKKKLADCYLRFNDIAWGDDLMAIVTERWYKNRAERRVFIKPANQTFRVNLFDRYYENAYNDPGDFVYRKNDYHQDVLLMDSNPLKRLSDPENVNIFTISEGASTTGNRPFLLKFNTKTKKTDTIFRSKAPYYEKPLYYAHKKELILSRESVDKPANFYLHNLDNKTDQALTDFQNPYPQMAGVKKQTLAYKRRDGLSLGATLYLPAGYTIGDKPLPTLVWAYPREYKTSAAAAQIRTSPYQFSKISWASPVFWVTQGYAVVDNADMPVVGESNIQPNDSFVEQIKQNADALVTKITEMGVADKEKIAVGGHSYGAFMTANLLAHTNLFATGIARSGAYNRTLTPFGFQAEERTYWQAPDVYFKMSPFSYANKIKSPVLLIHGEADDNSGTFPIQSERFYSALKGFGVTSKLVFLPAEAHSYKAKESVLHMLFEMNNWLQKYVKDKKN